MFNHRERTLRFYKERRAEGHRPQQARAIAKHDAKYKDTKKPDILPSRYDAYDGKEITDLPNGWKINVEFQRDEDTGAPWKECDGHGKVYETRYREDHMDDWELNSERGWYRYYDWKDTLPIAIRERWDAAPYHTGTKHEQAMRAMKADCEYLRRWCQDDWWYVGMIVTLLDENDKDIAEDSCWGYESDCIDYLASEARSWAAHMIVKARKERRKARVNAAVEKIVADAMAEGERV